FGLRNNPFGDHMVDVFSKSGFLARKDTQAAATMLRAQALQLVPESPVAIAHVLDCAPAVDFAIAIDGDIRDTQIDPQHIVNIDQIGCFNLGSGEQIPFAAHEGEITFAASERQHSSLSVSADKRDFLPPVERPDRNSGVLVSVGEDTIIVSNRAEWGK